MKYRILKNKRGRYEPQVKKFIKYCSFHNMETYFEDTLDFKTKEEAISFLSGYKNQVLIEMSAGVAGEGDLFDL